MGVAILPGAQQVDEGWFTLDTQEPEVNIFTHANGTLL